MSPNRFQNANINPKPCQLSGTSTCRRRPPRVVAVLLFSVCTFLIQRSVLRVRIPTPPPRQSGCARAPLHGEPCDDRRDDDARREGARPCDQQLVEAQHRQRPRARGLPRRSIPIHRDDAEDDHAHNPRLDQRDRQPPRHDDESGGGPVQHHPRRHADEVGSSRHQRLTGQQGDCVARGAQRGAGEHDGERGLLPLPLGVTFPRGRLS
eukprot:gene17106-biopygen7637